MSETLRDLVVSLSLQSDNFTRNMASVNKQIKEAEASFKLASAGVEHFDQDAVALGAQLSALQQKLSLQKIAVDQYSKALQAAQEKLQECYSRQTDYAQRLVDAKNKQQALKEQVGRAAEKVKEYSNTLGESDSSTIAAKQNLDRLREEYKNSCDEVRKLSGQNTALKKSTQNAADAVTAAATKLSTAKTAVKETEGAIANCSRSLSLSETNWYAAGEAIQRANAAITSIGKQMQLAESKFRLATAGIKKIDTSAEGLSAQLTLLQDKLTLQEQAVRHYEAALAAAKEQLVAAQQAGDTEKVRQASDAVLDAEAALNRAKAAVKETKAAIDGTNQSLKTSQSQWTKAGETLEAYANRCEAVSKAMTKAGRVLSVAMTAPIVALGKTAIEASLDFESSFTSVRKTVEATEEEYAFLAAASKKLSTQVAASTSEINEVLATGGQLGIATENLTGFTRVMIDLGNSCEDLSADEAASSLAKFANVMKTDQRQFEQVGSVLVDLGNNYATTEKAIMEMAQRLAGAGRQVGLSEAQVMGFAAALSSVGIEAQMGGSAFSKALVKMEVASATGGKALDDFGKVAGMTGKQFKKMWDTDPAAAFQSFIVGLSKMDEEGFSAIAVLDEIGIKEIRLRDTLLRATNATELFANTQKTANRAWQENTALATEANKRYNTTESKLINLKNKALLFAQQLGDDLNPTIQKLIQGASDLLDKFMGLDEAQRLQIIKFAAIAAAAGPALLTFGKVAKGISVITGGIGKFASAVGKAGGGFSGFMQVLGSSSATWFALAAAIIVGVHALHDYASGAKAARDSMNAMKTAAAELKKTGVKTFYSTGTTDVLARFGLSTEDFQTSIDAAKTWMEALIAVWTDGKKETNEIVAQYVEDFTSASDAVRDGIQQRKENLKNLGLLDRDAENKMDRDLAQLVAWDNEIQTLLKRRQNKLLTEKDRTRLDEIIQLRAQLQIEYIGPESGAYEQIIQGIENEKARAEAVSGIIQLDLYGDALSAAAQGQKIYLDALNEEYDARRANLLLIGDEEQRVRALGELDTWYAARRQANADAYEQTVSQIGSEAFQDESLQLAISSIGDLYALLQRFDGSTESLRAVQTWMDGMDGGGLASVLTLMTQLKNADIDEAVLGFDPSGILAQWQSISDIASAFPEQLAGLSEVINEIVPSEVREVLIQLNLDAAAQQWEAFIEGKDAFSVTANLTADPAYVTVDGEVVLKPLDQHRIALWKSLPHNQVSLSGQVNTTLKLALGEDWKDKLDTLWAEERIKAYGVNGLPIDVTPEVIQALSTDDIVLGVDKDGTYHVIVKPTWERASEQDVKDALGKLGDRANANNGLFGSSLLGMDALDSLKWANHFYKQYGQTSFHGLIPLLGLGEARELKNADNYITKEMAQQMADSVAIMVGAVKNGEQLSPDSISFLYDIADALGYIAKYGKNEELPAGILQNLSAMGINMKSNDLPDYLRNIVTVTRETDATTDAVKEACKNTAQYIALAKEAAHESGVYVHTSQAKIQLAFASALKSGVKLEDAQALMKSASSYSDALEKLYGAMDEAQGSHVPVEEMNEDLAFLTAYCDAYYQAMQRLEAGDASVSQETLSALDRMLTEGDITGITETFNQLGISLGDETGAGIGAGLADYDFSSEATSSAAALEAALRTAYDAHSPANLTKPVGQDVAAGIGEGMIQYDPTTATKTTADSVLSALRANMNASGFQTIGLNIMAGITVGIRAGRSGVISAVRSAARAAVHAAKAELDIHSPSGVFRNEVGKMTMKGFGMGVLEESKEQGRILRNAMRHLTEEASLVSLFPSKQTMSHKTYNHQSSVNLSGNTFYIRDEQDIHALAVEIAALTRRQQRGKGLRMA